MAEHPDLPVMQPTSAQPLPAPTYGASHFALVITPVEMLLAVGHSRIVMTSQAPGQAVQPLALQEWIMTLAISPTAALALSA